MGEGHRVGARGRQGETGKGSSDGTIIRDWGPARVGGPGPILSWMLDAG